MLGDLIKTIVDRALGPLLDRIPNPNERARAKEEAEERLVNQLTELMQGQLEINKTEAQHDSVFVAGWRPFVGWVCASGLAWNYIVQPLLLYVAWLVPEGADVAAAPQLDIADLLVVLGGMLGLGTLRTAEKWKGVAREGLKDTS